MGISDSIGGMVGKGKDAVGGHTDEAEKTVDAAGDKVDDMTGDKSKDKVDKGQRLANDQIHKLKK
jgi:antitoxin protein of toxin-antitoxin system